MDGVCLAAWESDLSMSWALLPEDMSPCVSGAGAGERAREKQMRDRADCPITIFLAWDILSRPLDTYSLQCLKWEIGFILSGLGWFGRPRKAEVGFDTLWTHSPFPWVPEAVKTWADPLASLSLLFPICQVKLILAFLPAPKCRWMGGAHEITLEHTKSL